MSKSQIEQSSHPMPTIIPLIHIFILHIILYLCNYISVSREPTAEYDYVLRLLILRTTASPLPELPPPLLRWRLSPLFVPSRLRVYHSSYLGSATILSSIVSRS